MKHKGRVIIDIVFCVYKFVLDKKNRYKISKEVFISRKHLVRKVFLVNYEQCSHVMSSGKE